VNAEGESGNSSFGLSDKFIAATSCHNSPSSFDSAAEKGSGLVKGQKQKNEY